MAKQVTRYESDAATEAQASYDEGAVRDGEAAAPRRLWWKNTSTAAEVLEACQVRRQQSGANDGYTFVQLAADVPLSAPGAPSGAAVAGTGLEVGDYLYKVTFVTANGETTGGTASATITTSGGNQQVDLTGIPTGPAGTTARKLYRTAVGGSTYGLIATIANNTATTYSDTVPDASRGAAPPTLNTSGAAGTWGIATITIGDMAVGDYAACWMRYNITAGTTQVGNPRAAEVVFEEAT